MRNTPRTHGDDALTSSTSAKAASRAAPVRLPCWSDLERKKQQIYRLIGVPIIHLGALLAARNIHSNASLQKRFASSLVSARTALNGLDLAFDAGGQPIVAVLSVAQIDWSMAKRELAVTRAPFFSAVVSGAGARQSMDAAATLEKLKGLPLEEATTVLLDMVVEEIARVLRLVPKEVDRHRPLAEIGMDSLMMLELRATVESTLQVDLPMMSLAAGITPSDIARRVAALLLGVTQPEKVSGRLMALSGSHLGTEVEHVDSDEHLAAAKAVIEQSKKLQGSL